MSNKIGEWIDNKTHPLQELDEARYAVEHDTRVPYEKILLYFKYVDSPVKVDNFSGECFLRSGKIYSWCRRFLIMEEIDGSICLYDLSEEEDETFIGEVELIAYMLIPECEVRRE